MCVCVSGYPEGGVPQPADGRDGHAGPSDGQGEHHATAQPADPLLSRQSGQVEPVLWSRIQIGSTT